MNIKEWLGLSKKPVQTDSKHKECIKIEDLTLQKAGDNTTWEKWDALWKKMMLTVPEYSKPWKEYKYNSDVIPLLSRYFSKPKDVPFNNLPTISIEKHIILWAIENDNNDVVQKCKSISYPVLDIVKSVLRCPDNWDILYEFKEAPCNTIGYVSTLTYYTYKGSVVLGKQNIYGIAFTQLERELIEWCEGRINKIVTERNMNKKREEFNNAWKELNV